MRFDPSYYHHDRLSLHNHLLGAMAQIENLRTFFSKMILRINFGGGIGLLGGFLAGFEKKTLHFCGREAVLHTGYYILTLL